MVDILRRLVVPFLLVCAVVGATIAIGEVGNEDLPEATDGTDGTVTTEGPETPVLSIRRAPTLLTSPRANETLRAELADWVLTLPSDSCFVISAGSEVLFEHNPQAPLVPASNMKILTAYAALELLGPDYTYTTHVKAAAEPDADGRIAGDLYVIGGGDPLLATSVYAAVQPPEDSPIRTNADELADQTIAANIANIDGGVMVDESRYDDKREIDAWSPRFLEQGQVGSLSAALLDDGFEGWRDGYPEQPFTRSESPAALFASNFDDMLEAKTVKIKSRPGVVSELPEGLVELASVTSPPMSQIVRQMMVNSDNTTSEMLVKELAVADGQAGTTTSGTLALRAVLTAAGLDDIGAFIEDGSGLSETNRLTCSLVHGALDDPSHKDALRAAMPVAGESGTLADSFIGTDFEGRLRAKTGFLSQVSALSGYFVTDPGVEVTFALIINSEGPILDIVIDAWQAPLPGILASYPEGPPITDLQPKGVSSVPE